MLRLGIVDFDSSHAVEFTRRFNHIGIDASQWVEGARVVVGCPGTSAMSAERIPPHTTQIEACGVRIVDEPAAMLGEIDAVLVLSLCGQAHEARARPFIEAGLPVYVDKPFACSIDDAQKMLEAADRHGGALFSASAMRFSDDVRSVQSRLEEIGPLHGVAVQGPAKRADGNPGLFHYGIHIVELLLTLMGAECVRLSNIWTDDVEVVTAQFRDGRAATLRGIRRGHTAYGFTAYCEGGVIHQTVSSRFAYRNLCRKLVKAFSTGETSLTSSEMLAPVRFVLAALESERLGGGIVSLE